MGSHSPPLGHQLTTRGRSAPFCPTSSPPRLSWLSSCVPVGHGVGRVGMVGLAGHGVYIDEPGCTHMYRCVHIVQDVRSYEHGWARMSGEWGEGLSLQPCRAIPRKEYVRT